MLEIVKTGKRGASENMAIDSALLEDVARPTLHFYSWENPSITYGYFLDVYKFLKVEGCLGIDIARRPTGGGVVFHMWDMAFSFLMPSDNIYFFKEGRRNYRFVNGIVRSALSEVFGIRGLYLIDEDIKRENFCMGGATRYDILFQGRKVVGAAQRRKREGYLHQATISLILPEKEILAKMVDLKVLEYLFNFTYPLLDNKRGIEDVRGAIEDALIKNFKKVLGS